MAGATELVAAPARRMGKMARAQLAGLGMGWSAAVKKGFEFPNWRNLRHAGVAPPVFSIMEVRVVLPPVTFPIDPRTPFHVRTH